MRKSLLMLIVLLLLGSVTAHSFTIPEWNQEEKSMVAPADKYLSNSMDVDKSVKGMFTLGMDHILDKDSKFFNVPTPFLNDHGYLLLGILLIPGYLIGINKSKAWKLGEMATAFAVGHGIAIFTVFLGLFSMPSFIVETGIAFSIALIGLERLAVLEGKLEDSMKRVLPLMLIVGFWHGNGFSAVVEKVSIVSGMEAVKLLSAFTLGVDLGQFLFMAGAGTLLYFVMKNCGEDKTIRFVATLLVLVGMSLTVFRLLPVLGGLL